MSVAHSILVTPSRNTLFTVRLAPYLVETLCELTRALRDKTHAQAEVSGLLFGTFEDGMATVEALKTFKDSGPRSELARRERMDKAFDAALMQARADPEIREFRLMGWFSLRNGSGLMNRDIDFHNTHFKGEDDIALVIWREAETQIIAELYADKPGSKLTSEDYRWSSVRLSTELRRVSEPLDLAMRLKTSEDSYNRRYAAPDTEERKDEWRKLAASAKRTILWFLPGLGKPDEYTLGAETESQREAAAKAESRKPGFEAKAIFVDTPTVSAVTPTATDVSAVSAVPIPTRESRRADADQEPVEITGLPMVIEANKKRRPAVPWFSMALVFLLFCAVTFGVFALRGLSSGTGKLAQIIRVVFPSDDLGLRIESQGERLLLSWNRRNPAVSSASSAILHIHDAGQNRDIKLDSSQVAEGAVLYTPVSGDVTFRLDVTGADRATTTGSIRVLDATNPATNTRASSALDVSGTTTVGNGVQSTPANSSAANPASKVSAESGSPVMQSSGSSKGHSPAQVPGIGHLNSGTSLPPPPITAVQNSVQPGTTLRSTDSNTTTPQQEAPHTQEPGTNSPAAAPKQNPMRIEPHKTTPQTGGTAISPWEPDESSQVAQPSQPVQEAEAKEAKQQDNQSQDAKTLLFVGPKVLLQVLPNTHLLSHGMVSQVTRVEVEVRIDLAGHVKSAHVVNNGGVKSALAMAALSAAKQWTFQPATLRGEKVESDHTIVFEFRPENQ